MSIKLRKVIADLITDPAKSVMLVLAIAVGVFAIGTMLGSDAVLTREMATNYLGTVPASATIRIDPARSLSQEVVADIGRLPGVEQADRRATITGRMRVGEAWRPLLLFVIDDFDQLKTNRITRESGSWPPPKGTMLVERTALAVMQRKTGEVVNLRTPHGEARDVTIAGVVHDPGLAPAWQEKEGYAYITLETLRWLGETQGFDELRVILSGQALTPADLPDIEARANTVAKALAGKGYTIHEIDVPPPRMHPHQGQMNAVLSLFTSFGFLTLILGAILVANAMATLMAKQVREIGVMKTIGATSLTIARWYFLLITALAAVAIGVGVPLSRLATWALVGAIANLLNLDIFDRSVPHGVLAVQVASGLLIPIAVAAFPIAKASRTTIAEALTSYGVSTVSFGIFDKLMLKARAFRRNPNAGLAQYVAPTLALVDDGNASGGRRGAVHDRVEPFIHVGRAFALAVRLPSRRHRVSLRRADRGW